MEQNCEETGDVNTIQVKSTVKELVPKEMGTIFMEVLHEVLRRKFHNAQMGRLVGRTQHC